MESEDKIFLSKEDAEYFFAILACPPQLNDKFKEAFEKYHENLNLRLNTIENRLDGLENPNG